MKVGIIGGTGGMGKGFAIRWCKENDVLIGSRDATRAVESATKYGVETFDNLKKRVLDMVEYVRDKHPGESVVLVTHMDPIKAAVSYAMNLNAESIHDFVIANASLTILGMEDKMAWIRAINLMPISRFDDEI